MKKIDTQLNNIVVEYLKEEDKAYLFMEYKNLFESLKDNIDSFNIQDIEEQYANRTIMQSKRDALIFFKNISKNYDDIIKDGLKTNKIFIYPKNESYLYNSFFDDEFKGDEPYMKGDNLFLPMKRNYSDLVSIIHECGHFIELHYSMYSFRNVDLLSEVLSIFFEKLLFYNSIYSYDNLSAYYNRISFDYNSLERLLEYYIIYDLWENKKLTADNISKHFNIDNEKEVISLIDDILDNDVGSIFKYSIGNLIANNLLNIYLDNPKTGIKTINNYLTKCGSDSFIKSLNILNLNTKNTNNGFVIKDSSINNLIDNAINDINYYNSKVKKRSINL